MSERQVYAVSGISTAVLVGGASGAMPPPAPAQMTCPWHSHTSAGTAFLQELDRARGHKLSTARLCFVSTGRASALQT